MHLDEHFGLLLEMPSLDRDRYIAELELREPEMSGVLRELFDDDAPIPERPRIKPGGRLGDRFRLIRPFAVGGFGAVWLAHDDRLDRSCAVKVFPPSDAQAEDRVMTEARTAAKIRSQHVVEVFDAGRANQGGPLFIAMELIAEVDAGGVPISKPKSLTQANLTSVGEIVEVLQQICGGVSAAHRMGVLHRDIKPDNCFWLGGVAKIGDFGLSSACPPPPSSNRRSTATMSLQLEDRQLVGTPAYMAPELVEGKSATVASDIYALGATLYHLLAGHPPYEPTAESDTPGLDVVRQVREARPPRISKVAKWVPRRLARIVDHAMSRDPRARYISADDLRFELESFARDLPGLMVGTNALSRAALFAKRNAPLMQLATLALVFVAVVGFAAFAARSDALEERTKRMAVEERLVAEAVSRSTVESVLERTQRAAAAAMTRARVAELEREQARARTEMLAREKHALEQAHAALKVQLDTTGQALEMAHTEAEAGRTDKATLGTALAKSRARLKAVARDKATAEAMIEEVRRDRDRAQDALLQAERDSELATLRAAEAEAALAAAMEAKHAVEAALAVTPKRPTPLLEASEAPPLLDATKPPALLDASKPPPLLDANQTPEPPLAETTVEVFPPQAE